MKKGNHLKAILVLTLILLFLGAVRFELIPEGAVYSISRPIYQVFSHLGKRISSFGYFFGDKSEIREERDRLRLEKQDLLIDLSRKNHLLAEKESLLEAVKVSDRVFDWQTSIGRVSYFNSSQDWFLINLGQRDGVVSGQPVINSRHVLIGLIEEAYRNQSRVRMISHADSLVKAKTVRSEGFGLLRGMGGLRAVLSSTIIDQPIRVGDNLVTDFFKDQYPAGLLIGQIVSLEKDDIRSLMQAEVSLFFLNFRPDIILVIKEI